MTVLARVSVGGRHIMTMSMLIKENFEFLADRGEKKIEGWNHGFDLKIDIHSRTKGCSIMF